MSFLLNVDSRIFVSLTMALLSPYVLTDPCIEIPKYVNLIIVQIFNLVQYLLPQAQIHKCLIHKYFVIYMRQCQQKYHHIFVSSTFIYHLTWSCRKPLWDKTSCWHCIGGKPFRIEWFWCFGVVIVVCICINLIA